MKTHLAAWFSCSLLALAACSDSTPSTQPDASSDVAVDTPRDGAMDVPLPPCPAGPGRPSGACSVDGQVCAYNDPRPECGGVRMICRSGAWAELKHTDPAASCFDSGPGDVISDVADDRADVVSDVVDASDASDASVNACATASGICVSSATACTSGGGTVAAAGASGCRFSDGDGVCCVPPSPQQMGDACSARGGVCAPIAGCNFVRGSFGPQDGSGCTGVGVVCCLPRSICGDESVVCCGATASFRPACDRGTWRCTISGTTLVPTEMCRF